jgi:hypothetical protein
MKDLHSAGGFGLRLLLVVTLIWAFPILSWSQGSLGGLTGHVTDASGAVVAGVSIKITNLQSGEVRSVVTTSDGTYLAPGLTPGQYQVIVSRPGLQTVTQQPVNLSTATVSTLDFAMQVGTVTQSITVSGAEVELQTTSAEIGTVMPEKGILDLPISLGNVTSGTSSGRRQIQSFIYLTPGVTGDAWSTSINGSPGMSAEVLMDGADMQNIGAPGFIAEMAPPYEAVSEFKVQNTMYPAEYGAGYGVMNFTMKSGANQFHGDLFEFVRNDTFDANGFFHSDQNRIRQNEFGATVGGPVILPHYNGRDKTHFFVAWSSFRLRGGVPRPGFVTLPTLQERNGDFSDYPFPIFDPATTRSDGNGGFFRSPFANNVIPSDRISEVAKRVISLIPPPDIPGAPFFNYVDRSFTPSHDDNWSAKIDHQLTSKQHLSGAFWQVSAAVTRNGAVAGELNPSFQVAPTDAIGLRLNHVWTITPTLLNHAVFGVTRVTPTWAGSLLDPRQGNKTLQIPGIPLDSHGFSEFHFSQNYQYLGNTSANGLTPELFKSWVWNDDLTKISGRHSLQFGFGYRRRSINDGDDTYTAGAFSFSNLSTSQPNDPNFQSWGNDFASFMLGQVYSAQRAIAPPDQHFHDSMFSFYAQDSMKVTKKLTLGLGLRYELPIYAVEDNGIMALLDPARPNPGAGGLPGALTFFGNGPGRNGRLNLFGTYHKAISPRLSLAYQVDPKTVLRLGYGLFRLFPNYGDLNNPTILTYGSGFGALIVKASTDSGITPAFLLDQGFPASDISLPNTDPSLNNGGTVTWINSHSNRPALMNTWTLDIQRELPFNMLLDAAYVGSRTTGLTTGLENINQVNPKYLSLGNLLLADVNSPEAAAAGIRVPYPGFQGSVAQALRPFPQYNSINDFYQPTGFGTYHSLQARLQKRYSNGLFFLASYTLSKNIGTVATNTFGSWFGGGGYGAMDTYNRGLEKSIASFDRTHVFVFSWAYELPFGPGKRFLAHTNPIVKQLVGGWQFNAIHRYQSGTPIAVSGGSDLSQLFGGGNRPNWISNNVRTNVSMSSFDPARDVYLNINAFSQPAPFTFGNAPPRLPTVRGPAFYNEDFSVFKKFYLASEFRYFEFRTEFFNVLNRVVLGNPSSNVNNAATFGMIFNQANPPRVIQMALKFIF